MSNSFEYKIINKNLMRYRVTDKSSWNIGANIFEAVKAYLLWDYGKDMLPHFPPYFDYENFPELAKWYTWLSKPNASYRRNFKCTPEEYKKWLINLDISKTFDASLCDKVFEDDATKAVPIEVDSVAIAEAENE